MIYYTKYQSPVGSITLGSDGEKLIGLWIDGQKYDKDVESEDFILNSDLPIFKATERWLDQYFRGEEPSINKLALAPRGSDFQKYVWDLLCQVPYGETETYKSIAEKTAKIMGKSKMSAQAVGGAVGRNPISIIIPCHRIVGTNGSLTGYGGGIDKKITLLKHEGLDMSKFYVPKKGTAL